MGRRLCLVLWQETSQKSTNSAEREQVRAETPDLGSWEKRECVLCGNALATLSQTDVAKMARNRPDGGSNQQMEGGEECCAPPRVCVWRGGARASPAGTHREVAWVERWSADFSGGQGASRRSEAAERRSEPVSSPVLEGPGDNPNPGPRERWCLWVSGRKFWER